MTDRNEKVSEAKKLMRGLTEKCDQLTLEVSRLQGDVRSLKSIYLSPDTIKSQQKISLESQKMDAQFSSKRDYTLKETLGSIESARRNVRNIEADVQAIRSQLDQILNSNYKRIELKRLMIDPNDPKNK